MILKIGCCGFPVTKKRYFEELKVLEIQKTFYQPPERKVVEKWAKEKPYDFEYTIKAWQLITHTPKSPTYKRLKEQIPETKKSCYGFFKPTDEVFSAWKRTEEIARILCAKIVVFQTPQSFLPTEENKKNLKKFFLSIGKGFIFGLELRGWSERDIEHLLKGLNIVHVVDPFTARPLCGSISYFRLHGKGSYNYRYSREELHQLKSFLSPEKENYVFFNNTYMFENALEFRDLMRRFLSSDPRLHREYQQADSQGG